MSDDKIHLASLDVDDQWIVCWAELGIAALEASLAKHAAFEAYLRVMHDSDRFDGDGRTDG